MSDFGEQVEQAAAPLPKVWRLMVWDVPDRLGALMGRLGFRPTRKNHAHYWRIFDPNAPADKVFAERCRAELLAAGLKGSWQQIDKRAWVTLPKRRKPSSAGGPWGGKKFKTHPPRPSREGFGGKLNARPIKGSWRRR